MKTLYKNTNLIAVAILCSMLLAAGTAVAVVHERDDIQVANCTSTQAESLGRFVVTPTKSTFIASAKSKA